MRLRMWDEWVQTFHGRFTAFTHVETDVSSTISCAHADVHARSVPWHNLALLCHHSVLHVEHVLTTMPGPCMCDSVTCSHTAAATHCFNNWHGKTDHFAHTIYTWEYK